MSPMSETLVLLAPAANHVYAGQAGRLCTAELSLTCPNATSVAPVTVAGIEYLSIHSEGVSNSHLTLPTTPSV